MSYAQYGEDTLVDELLGSPEEGTFVDVGAGDGVEISNSRLFRERGWDTYLVEADARRAADLIRLDGHVTVVGLMATPENINDLVPPETTVLSIDVDGDDYFLLEALVRRSAIIIIEHNPTIPRHLDVFPARLGLRVGASVAALTRVAEAKGYGLVAVTHCNAIFRLGAESIPIEPAVPEYGVATEYFTGRPVVVGKPPWGVDFDSPLPVEDVIER